MRLVGIFLTIFLGCATFTFAQTCCSGGIPLSNNIGLAHQNHGILQLGLNYDFNNLNTLKNGDETLNDDARLRITHSTLLNVGYAITDDLAVEGLFTWVNQRRKINQGNFEALDQSSGIGDAVVLVNYRFSNVLGLNSGVNIGVGGKIPLGSSTEKNDQGITLNADLQPGSNAWDLILLADISKNFDFRPTLTFSSRVTYRGTGKNTDYFVNSTYEFGNEFQTFFNLSDQFILFKTTFSPILSFKYRNAQQDEIDGFKLANTGGKWVAIIPGYTIDLNSSWSFLTKAEIPIYSNVDGTQLTPTYRITAGVLFKLNLKKSKFLKL